MKRLLFVILLLSNAYVYSAHTIYIDRGVSSLLSIAINDFIAESPLDKKTGNDILSVINNDLNHSKIFHIISHKAFIDNGKGINHKPIFATWRQINATALLNGEIKRINQSSIELKVILWDVVSEKILFAESFKFPVNSWRKVAHDISDKIYERLSGEKGYFNTKIAYIAEDRLKNNRIRKRVAVMDYDGANHRFITDGRHIVITPRISPQGDKLLYVSYERKKPKVYLKDLNTGAYYQIGNMNEMSFAPRFSNDGTKILLSLARRGITNIYELDLTTHKMKQLTYNNSISTSGTYSPDGKTIYFNSNRNGTRQLYSMNHDGTNIQKISFGEGAYAAPTCSPNGRYIAFTKIIPRKGFYIGIMNTDGSNEKLLARGYLVEGTTWSPNSRILAFARTTRPTAAENSKTYIYTIDINDLNEQLVNTPGEGSDPEWIY